MSAVGGIIAIVAHDENVAGGDFEYFGIVELAPTSEFEDRMLAASRQRLDLACRGLAAAVLHLDQAGSGAANRQHDSIDKEMALAHLHAVARQADDPLDVALARVARQAEHHHIA